MKFAPGNRRWFFCVAVCSALAVAAWPADAVAQAGAGSRVLVMPFAAESDPKAPGGAGAARWLSEAAAVLVSEGLGTRGVGVVPRDDRVAVFDRLQLPMSFPLTRATTIRVGDLIGASEIVSGEIKLGQTLAVRVRLIRLTTGQQLPEIADEAPLTEIFKLFDRMSERIAGADRPADCVAAGARARRCRSRPSRAMSKGWSRQRRPRSSAFSSRR